MILLALALQAATIDPAADELDIPTAFLGHWAIERRFCAVPGPANVEITARRIDFWERHGFLDLAKLNEADDPPTFYGSFRWLELLRFSASAVRLEIIESKLYVTESDDPDAPRSKVAWSRCD